MTIRFEKPDNRSLYYPEGEQIIDPQIGGDEGVRERSAFFETDAFEELSDLLERRSILATSDLILEYDNVTEFKDLVFQRLEELGIAKTKFCRQLGVTTKLLYKELSRESLREIKNPDLIQKICWALKIRFNYLVFDGPVFDKSSRTDRIALLEELQNRAMMIGLRRSEWQAWLGISHFQITRLLISGSPISESLRELLQTKFCVRISKDGPGTVPTSVAEIADYSKSLRAEWGMKQQELADALGVTRAYVFQVEAEQPTLERSKIVSEYALVLGFAPLAKKISQEEMRTKVMDAGFSREVHYYDYELIQAMKRRLDVLGFSLNDYLSFLVEEEASWIRSVFSITEDQTMNDYSSLMSTKDMLKRVLGDMARFFDFTIGAFEDMKPSNLVNGTDDIEISRYAKRILDEIRKRQYKNYLSDKRMCGAAKLQLENWRRVVRLIEDGCFRVQDTVYLEKAASFLGVEFDPFVAFKSVKVEGFSKSAITKIVRERFDSAMISSNGLGTILKLEELGQTSHYIRNGASLTHPVMRKVCLIFKVYLDPISEAERFIQDLQSGIEGSNESLSDLINQIDWSINQFYSWQNSILEAGEVNDETLGEYIPQLLKLIGGMTDIDQKKVNVVEPASQVEPESPMTLEVLEKSDPIEKSIEPETEPQTEPEFPPQQSAAPEMPKPASKRKAKTSKSSSPSEEMDSEQTVGRTAPAGAERISKRVVRRRPQNPNVPRSGQDAPPSGQMVTRTTTSVDLRDLTPNEGFVEIQGYQIEDWLYEIHKRVGGKDALEIRRRLENDHGFDRREARSLTGTYFVWDNPAIFKAAQQFQVYNYTLVQIALLNVSDPDSFWEALPEKMKQRPYVRYLTGEDRAEVRHIRNKLMVDQINGEASLVFSREQIEKYGLQDEDGVQAFLERTGGTLESLKRNDVSLYALFKENDFLSVAYAMCFAKQFEVHTLSYVGLPRVTRVERYDPIGVFEHGYDGPNSRFKRLYPGYFKWAKTSFGTSRAEYLKFSRDRLKADVDMILGKLHSQTSKKNKGGSSKVKRPTPQNSLAGNTHSDGDEGMDLSSLTLSSSRDVAEQGGLRTVTNMSIQPMYQVLKPEFVQPEFPGLIGQVPQNFDKPSDIYINSLGSASGLTVSQNLMLNLFRFKPGLG